VKKYKYKMKKILTLIILISGFAYPQLNLEELKETPKSDIFMQGFYWNSPPGGNWYDSLSQVAARLAASGFSGIWFPSPVKGAGGGFSMGYDPYDHYDFGEFNQKGSRETRFGSRSELINAINAFHSVGIKVFADAVVRHMMGGEIKTNYECRPLHNGNYIVPDSAYLTFNYPNGSGRFKKDASTFYPNSQNCWVDPLFVQIDPIFRFGEWLDHNKDSVRDSLVQWGKYLRNTLGFDGFRLDAVKAIDPAFMAHWLKNTNVGGYAVAELWGSISEIGNWLNVCKNINGGSVSMFDFPLRYELKYMCNNSAGTYDMNNLDNAGLVNAGVSGFDVATFVENHDFDRVGWDGQIDNGHDPVISDKQMAYAYIIFSEGRPAVFFKDYFDYGFAGKIDTLNWIRQRFISGGTTKRNGLNPWYVPGDDQAAQSRDLYVARRNGGSGSPQVFLVLNDHPTEWRGVYVNTDHPNQVFRDYTGVAIDKQSYADGRVELWAPPRGYAIYVPDTTSNVNFPPVITKVPDLTAYTNSQFSYKISVANLGSILPVISIINKPSWLNLSVTGEISGVPSFADTGSISLVVNVVNQYNLADSDTFNINIIKNFRPVIQSINDTSVQATKRFEIQAIASDADWDSLYFSFSSAPSWLNIERNNGLISATPTLTDTGYYNIRIMVNDGKGGIDSTSFYLTVTDVIDSIIFTYGKPFIDGNIIIGSDDWLEEWRVVTDSDTDSYWAPVDTLNNEIFGIFTTWDADSLYLGIDYIIDDNYNTMMLYLDAGLPEGITNFNSNQGYNGDYSKNFRFRQTDAIDYFIACYYLNIPLLYKTTSNSSEDISQLANRRRGNNANDLEVAVAWNDLYNLGSGIIPNNVVLKMVAIVAGGLNYGGGDSAPDNPDVNGDAGPDSLIYLATINPDENGDGIPDPTITITAIENKEAHIHPDFILHQNYPNPFNPSTYITYQIPVTGYVTLKIYDVLGKEIAVLVNESKEAGMHKVTFNATRLSSGVYYYKIQTGNTISVKKMLLIK